MRKMIMAMASVIFMMTGAFAQNENQSDDSRPLAFPGADGFGKYTTGGRGGSVVYVTTLNDNEKAGSLRWAVKRNGVKTILFKVAGTIQLQRPLDISRDNITIAGQSAPGEGICIAGAPVKIKGNNIILRYLRFRMGDVNAIGGDVLSVKNQKDIIIDHCSISWGTEECVTVVGVENFTMQWCIISEALNESVNQKGEYSYAGLWGGKNASYHHNLIAHCKTRNPRIDNPSVSEISGTMDISNNVLYNWGSEAIYGGELRTANICNNYFKPGPATRRSKSSTIFRPYDQTKKGTVVGYGAFYVDGNAIENNIELSEDNIKAIKTQSGANPKVALSEKPYLSLLSLIQPANEAYESVLEKAGCSFRRDPVDSRIVSEVKFGTATYGGSFGRTKGIIDSQNDVGGFPELKSEDLSIDSDKDGIPDMWEVLQGLNPDVEDSHLYTIDKNKQYTNLEMYLNSLVK